MKTSRHLHYLGLAAMFALFATAVVMRYERRGAAPDVEASDVAATQQSERLLSVLRLPASELARVVDANERETVQIAIEQALAAYFSGSRDAWASWANSSGWRSTEEIARIDDVAWRRHMRLLTRYRPQPDKMKLRFDTTGTARQAPREGMTAGIAMKPEASIMPGESASASFGKERICVVIPMVADGRGEVVYEMIFQKRTSDQRWQLAGQAFTLPSTEGITWPP